MHCDEVGQLLIEALDRPLEAADERAVAAHLEACTECQQLRESIRSMQSRTRVWHEVPAPRWNATPSWQAAGNARGGPAPVSAGLPGWGAWLQQWLPSLTSAAALVVVAALYLNGPAGTAPTAPAGDAGPSHPVAARGTPPGQLQAAATPVSLTDDQVGALLAASRSERQQELEALVKLLTAEMDRRSMETEQSLKYVIAHQIQGQRELSDIQQRIETLKRGAGDRGDPL
ncbi:MAG: zf-HC2 domain-containing protein [Pseudomonadales bacterium]